LEEEGAGELVGKKDGGEFKEKNLKEQMDPVTECYVIDEALDCPLSLHMDSMDAPDI